MTNMIDEIKDQIIEYLPEKVKLAKVEFEGPEIVIYTKNLSWCNLVGFNHNCGGGVELIVL